MKKMRAKTPVTLGECMVNGMTASVLVGLVHWKLGVLVAIVFVVPYVVIGGIRMAWRHYKKPDEKTV